MALQITKATDIKEEKGTYLIYSPPGIGKTTSIKFFPGKTLVLDVDRTTKVLKGEPNISIAKINNMETWKHWEEVVLDLTENYVGKFDNIVIDNISELERCLLSDLGSKGKNHGVPSIGNYQHMQFRLVNSLRYMKNLQSNIIMTAWEMTDLYTTSDGQQFNRSYPQLNLKILNNIAGLCDVVGKLTFNDEGKRGFVLAPTNSIFAKNQLDDRKGCLQSELIPAGDGVEGTKTVSKGSTK
ncbi:AAA family ATPase [Anaerosalibacter massiliensis]|uniref:AAA family ATPase n=1 Tax=Anaerosalibacter massiliensis TaxID=1347392 RepID=UPI0005B2A490|nr:AAA family ATPase [Anaerosalibacter massiliensis]